MIIGSTNLSSFRVKENKWLNKSSQAKIGLAATNDDVVRVWDLFSVGFFFLLKENKVETLKVDGSYW